MKLQLLITQYKETEDVITPMLRSIELQQGVDLKNDIEVIIGNDGSDVKLSDEFLCSFTYPISYLQFDHSGLPGCRAHLMDAAKAEYVMFCDADDMFLSNLGLYTILAVVEKGCDALVCDFMEEVQDKNTKRSGFFQHKRDQTFVHGKVYRRQFLLDNHIVWHPDILCHEDSCFNLLALKIAKDIKYCSLPLYLWKWRDVSICRGDSLYVPKTYVHMIESNTRLVQDFLARGMVEEAMYHVTVLVYGTYYMLNKPIWTDPMNAEYRYKTEKRFSSYFRQHRNLFNAVNPKVKNKIIKGTKRRVLNEGVLLECFTFDSWIRHIEKL